MGPHQWNVSVLALANPSFLKVVYQLLSMDSRVDDHATHFHNSAQKLIIVYELVYGPTIFFAKLSLLLLYLRIFSPNQLTRYLIYFGIAVNFLVYTATTVAFGYMCIPRPSQTWLEGSTTAMCKSSSIMNYIQGIFNVVSDFYILTLPIPVVWRLQMPQAKKVGVMVIFMTGLL